MSRQIIEADVIDEINILEASLLAMEQAVLNLEGAKPDFILLDGNQKPRVLISQPFELCSASLGQVL